MKPLQGDTVTNDSNCSCTSCDSKSESDGQTLRRLLLQGSRINRLINGKYHIPIRESKLLDKLVRTRALYDALRSQLLSSSLSVSSKADLKPRQSPIENRKALEEAKNSSDIFALVDLVDKGAILGSRKLSECCSCCTCNSKTRLHENIQKGRRNRQAHVGGNITSRSSLVSKQDAGEAKNIKSDPCTCACKQYELMNLKSREIFKKVHPEQPIIERDYLLGLNKHKFMSTNNGKLRKSYHKLKRSKAYPNTYMENIGEGGNKIRKSKQSREKLELLKLAQKTIRDSFIADQKAMQKYKPEKNSRAGNITVDNHDNKNQIRLQDKSGHHETQNSELSQRIEQMSKKIFKTGKENTNYSSTTSITSIRKGTTKKEPITTVSEQQKKSSLKRNKTNVLSEIPVDAEMKKKLKGPRYIEEQNDIKKSNKSGTPSVPPQKKISFKSMTTLMSVTSADVVSKTGKQLPLSKTQEPIKSNAARLPGKILKSTSTSSIEKSYSTSNKNSNARQTLSIKSSLKVSSNDNKIELKTEAPMSFHKRLRLLSAPMRFTPGNYPVRTKPVVRKDPRKQQQRRGQPELPRKREEPHQLEKSRQPEGTRQREASRQREEPRQIDKSGQREKSPQREERGKRQEPPERQKSHLRRKSRPREESQQRKKSGQHGESPQRKESQLSAKPSLRKESRQREQARLRRVPRLYDHEISGRKKDSEVKQKHIIKNIQAGSHALKRCLCSLKIKVKKTKSKINKNITKEIPKMEVTHSTHSKKLLSSVKSFITGSDTTDRESKYKSEKASICECSEYVSKSQSQVKRRNLHQSENIQKSKHKMPEASPAKPAHTDTRSETESSSHLSISECSDINSECKEKGRVTYKPGQSNKNFVKKTVSSHGLNKTKEKQNIQELVTPSDSSHKIKSSTHASICECFETNISKEEIGISKIKRGKSTLKDRSITREKRRLKNHSVQTKKDTPSNKQRIKFHPSHSKTKSIISHVSKGTEILPLDKRQKNRPFTSKQRISIEIFKKGNSINGLTINHSNAKTLHRNNTRSRQIRNKQSQISNSTGKSRYTITKHGLRRCFCTLKLLEKKKKYVEKLSKKNMIQPESKADSSQTKLKVKNVSISAEREMYHNLIRHIILPYECETSFCDPKNNNAKSYKIVHSMAKKEERKSIKHVKGNYRKSRSNSSLTSRSVQLPKNIHSTIVSHKSEIITPILKKNKMNAPDIATQQIKSSFTRNLLNRKRNSLLYAPIDKNNKIKKGIQIRPSKEYELKDYKTLKSVLLDNKKQGRSLLLGPTIRRCLCTLKLHKNGKYNKKSTAVNTDTTTNIIAEKKYPASKLKLSNRFSLHDSKYSKPSIFVTRDCNPYECLQKIQKRNNLKTFGVVTDRTKMVSKSSETRTLGSSSNHLFIKSDFKQRKISLQKFKSMRKHSELFHLSKRTSEIKPYWKHSIKMSSNLSFNINFYKDVTSANNINQDMTKNMNASILKNNQNSKLLVRHSDNLKSRLRVNSPERSRCFCALELLKKDEKRRGSKFLTPFASKKPTQVYTVSTVTIAETQIKSPETLALKDVDDDFRFVDSYDPTKKQALSHTKQWQYFKKKSTTAYKTKNMQSCIRENKCKLLQINPIKGNLLTFKSKETVKIKSQFSCEINYLKNECSKKDQILSNELSQNDTLELNQCVSENPQVEDAPHIIKMVTNRTPHTNPHQLTGVQPFLRRCYCTMNIQVAGQHSSKRRHHHSAKLKDYECEPGVCVPYECDPYECQRRIMKRLMKKVSKMSGTDNRLRTSASLTSSMSSGSKTRRLQSSLAHEQKHRPAKARPMGLKYQTLPRSPRIHRQAVRVGSAFSFDIEFSKQSKAPTAEIIKAPRRSTASRSSKTSYRHRRDRGTIGVGGERRHRESQSMMKQMRHRASSVTPMLKRCFCTLKLQKKGRQQKERELLSVHQGTSTPPKFQVEKPILRTTETSQNTKTKQRYPELLPYECEPGICIPGECDPYACLELIKRRKGKHTKDFGTDSIASRTSSSSSMTPSQKRRRKQIQSRNVRVKPIKSRDTAVRSKPSIMSIERQVLPSRQAVKLGSSFSFNIEFYKDKTSPHDIVKQSPEIYVHKTPKEVRKVPKHVYVQRKMREGYSQDGKSTRDTDSQIGILKHGQSTMTSGFLKRCFCTAKLQGINVDTQARHHQSFAALKRCFCTLKMLTASKREHSKPDNVGHETAPPLVDKHVVKTQTRSRSPPLLPYECEPGVCVPGYCDPHECEKLIRKRRAREKMAGTTGPRTRSTSSGFASSKTSKAGMTQSRSPRPPEKVRRRDHSPREIVIKEKVRSPVLPRRQAVKIGSSFSFDIEFYKDQFPNYHQVQAAATTVKKSRPQRKKGHGVNYGTKTRDKGLRERRVSVLSRDSQMDEVRKKDMAIGPILRRCFCTLKLYRQKQSKNIKQKQSKISKQTQPKIKKDKPMHQGTATPVVKEVATLQTRSVMTPNKLKPLPYKLEPYECEPGVCVPGECDPYECEKRIKKRLMNSSGTWTEHHQTRSTSNMTKYNHRHRDSEAQSAMERRKPIRTRDIQHKVRRPEYRSTVVERPSKQAVKIGSSFSFDIEFFKDKSPAGGYVSPRPVKQYATYERPRRTTSRSTEWRSISSRNKRAQRPKAVRDMDSQVLARKMRSTMTGVGPFLKRCFCTLQLHKSENHGRPFDSTSVSTKTEKVKIQPKPDPTSAEKSTHTRKQVEFHGRKLEPYECEPGVCVPGQCDPYECEKRIKRRMQSKQSGTEPHKGRSVSSSIGGTAKYRPRRTQARSYTPSQRAAKTSRGYDHFRGKDRVVYDSNPNRQAVRIGSSFSFNIEFYKDKSPQFPSVVDANNIISRDMRGTETRSTRTRSMSSSYKRAGLRDCQSQSDCIKTDCKGSCAPLLKRCFCTLKLQKMGKQQQYITHKTEPFTKSTGTRTKTKIEIAPIAREIGTKTKKYRHTLEPYECEPGVCVPGQCDPYECEKRIKLRNMKHFGTETTRPSMKSMSSLTSRDKRNNAMITQFYRDRCDKKRTPSTETIYRVRKPYQPEVADNANRQVVSLGSNFSFNMEFSKGTSSGQDDYENEVQGRYNPYTSRPVKYKSKASVSTGNGTKSRTRGSNGKGYYLDHRTSQAGTETESRGSGMGPLLKRCFCTLTLQRAEVRSKLNSPVPPKSEPSKVKTSEKKTSTKKKNIPPPAPTQYLEPDECEPGVCVPGECNPYECLERIKKRGIRRMSRTTGTRMKRTSQVSVSSMAAQFIPGYTGKRTQYKGETYSPQKIDRIIEEPRFPFLHGNARQGVRITSNFNINIEFYKETLPPMMAEDTSCQKKASCRAKDRCIECTKPSRLTRIGHHGTRNDLRSNESQSEPVKTEDKSSAVGILRRCFCTAKLHRSHLARSNHPQSLTVGRVEELRPTSYFGPKEYWVQYQIPNRMKKPLKTKGQTLETIMSPRKFNNNIKCCINHKCKFCRAHSPMDATLETEDILKESETKPSNLKKMLVCCKNIFKKRSIQQNVNNSEEKNVDQPEVKKKVNNRQPWIDILKPSKSERHPNKVAVPNIKKSKSLKVAKVGEINIHKKKFSRFQSGDADQERHATKAKNIKTMCPHCQAQFKHIDPVNKKVRFASLRSDKTSNPKDIVIEQLKDAKPISFLFKSRNFNNLEDVKLCPCCGGLKKKRFPSPSTQADIMKNSSLKNNEVTKKLDTPVEILSLPTRTVTFKEKTAPSKETKKKHKQPCPCCACKKKKANNIASNRPRNYIGKKGGPCVCGSVICKKEAERNAEHRHLASRRHKRKKCVCGTNICEAESEKEAHATESGYKRARKQKKKQKRLEKEAKIREKIYKAEDKEIMKKRKLNEKFMLKKLAKYKNTPDAMLVAESVLDIGKLGITSAGDILRNLHRAVFDPKRTYRNFQAFLRDPMRAWKKFQDAANTGPGVATLQRLKLRCQALKCVKETKEKLEEHPVTNFVIHANDTDPKNRFHPKRPAWRRRPDPSFGCSPFMLSLRKRPWLSVYYKCSWFYPHCLTLLQIWRQFMDIILFLLAVAVWSPCILCMELSRALMCCFLCTG